MTELTSPTITTSWTKFKKASHFNKLGGRKISQDALWNSMEMRIMIQPFYGKNTHWFSKGQYKAVMQILIKWSTGPKWTVTNCQSSRWIKKSRNHWTNDKKCWRRLCLNAFNARPSSQMIVISVTSTEKSVNDPNQNRSSFGEGWEVCFMNG